MKAMSLIRDDLDEAREFVECAYWACKGAVDDPSSNSIRTVLGAASLKLSEIDRELEDFRRSAPEVQS